MVGAHNKSVGHVLVFLHKHIMTKGSSIRRDISGVRGFSRETLVALIADIESREWRRGFSQEKGYQKSIPGQAPQMMWNAFSAFSVTVLGKILP